MTVSNFCDEVSADSAVPGGGSVAALAGSLGAALAAMVGNLSYRKPELLAVRDELAALAIEAQEVKSSLMGLVVEDSLAFTEVMEAMRLPKATDDEKAVRSAAIARASEHATMVPFRTLKLCCRAAELAGRMATIGYVQCLSDGGTGAAMALAGAEGAAMNVLINLASGKDSPAKQETRAAALEMLERTRASTAATLAAIHASFK